MNAKPTDPLRVHAAKQYADKLKRIPASQWCVGDYHDSKGRKCAAAHLFTSRAWNDNLKTEKEFSQVLGLPPAWVNDSVRHIGDRQVHTPKRNILRRLNQLIKGRA